MLPPTPSPKRGGGGKTECTSLPLARRWFGWPRRITGGSSRLMRLDVEIGGAELNTAVGLARLGRRAAWVSRLHGQPARSADRQSGSRSRSFNEPRAAYRRGPGRHLLPRTRGGPASERHRLRPGQLGDGECAAGHVRLGEDPRGGELVLRHRDHRGAERDVGRGDARGAAIREGRGRDHLS